MGVRRVLAGITVCVALVISSNEVAAASTNVYYAQTGLDGVIHCATAEQDLWVTNGFTVNLSAATRTSKNLYCGTAETYPASYMNVRVILKHGSTILIDRTSYNAFQTSAASDLSYFDAPPGTYTLQTRHVAAVNFASRIYPSTGYWTTSVSVS